MAAQKAGYGDPSWITFAQARGLGAHITRGEKAAQVSFWTKRTFEEKSATTGELEKKEVPLVRWYWVFNATQVEGLPGVECLPEMPATTRY